MGWAFDYVVAGLGPNPGPTVLVIEGPRILVGSVLGLASSRSICSSRRLRPLTIGCSTYIIIVCVLKRLCKRISWLWSG